MLRVFSCPDSLRARLQALTRGIRPRRKATVNCKHHVKGDGSWWAVDGRGIELCRVCGKCEREKLSHYAPEILGHYTSADVDESIESDEPW